MRLSTVTLAAALAIAVAVSPAHASRVNEAAPGFSVADSKGLTQTLDQHRGKWVVLEWHNQGCPYVRKHYEGGNMQRLQAEWTKKGVVWLTVISSAPGQQGHVSGADADAYVAKMKASPTAVLLDEAGAVGRAFEAKTTPHMFVIDPRGTLVYNGALDDTPTATPGDFATAKNYVAAALTDGMAGRTITAQTSRPYGCGIKYAQ
jgi:peroxiredoxin